MLSAPSPTPKVRTRKVRPVGVALHQRRTTGGQLAMLISGGLSTIAGLSFLASSGMDPARIATLAGYMAVGAVLFLVSARRGAAAT